MFSGDDDKIVSMCDEAKAATKRGDALACIQLCCSNDTPSTKDWELKELVAKTVLSGLILADKDTSSILESLNEDERANLLKYVYKGMALGENCSLLLDWHRALTDETKGGGLGIIARAMVDRKV